MNRAQRRAAASAHRGDWRDTCNTYAGCLAAELGADHALVRRARLLGVTQDEFAKRRLLADVDKLDPDVLERINARVDAEATARNETAARLHAAAARLNGLPPQGAA